MSDVNAEEALLSMGGILPSAGYTIPQKTTPRGEERSLQTQKRSCILNGVDYLKAFDST